MPGLQCTTSKHGDLIVVTATGDVDLATAESLWNELCAQLVPASAVSLECTEIAFIDSIGLRALMRAHRHAADQQASFALIGANAYVDQLLALTGLTGLIPRFPDIDTAQAELGGGFD